MDIKEILRVLLKDIGIPSITVEDMEFSHRDNYYWIAYKENGKLNPTIVEFTEQDTIGVDYTDEGNYIFVDSDVDKLRRFVRDISNNGLYFELDISYEIIEKLIQNKIKFSIVENDREKFCLTPDSEAQLTLVGEKGLSLKFGESIVWVYLTENSKIRIYS